MNECRLADLLIAIQDEAVNHLLCRIGAVFTRRKSERFEGSATAHEALPAHDRCHTRNFEILDAIHCFFIREAGFQRGLGVDHFPPDDFFIRPERFGLLRQFLGFRLGQFAGLRPLPRRDDFRFHFGIVHRFRFDCRLFGGPPGKECGVRRRFGKLTPDERLLVVRSWRVDLRNVEVTGRSQLPSFVLFKEEGIAKKVFVQKEDGSVWIDLTADGLDEKVVQRKDGTAVYITQDIGLAEQKQEEFKTQQSIYVVADEQNYHFKVLKLICEKLNIPGASGIYHLSYGMVELPTGRMKTREGTVVDADDLIEEMVNVARNKTEELGKVKDFTEEELKDLYDILAIGALKFFLLRVDPKKRMIFNPEESIDFHGFTGPFVQYTHARIRSILRKSQSAELGVRSQERRPERSEGSTARSSLLKLEKALIVELEQYPTIISQAVAEHNPSVIAIYVFNLAKTFNTFYSELSVMNAESEEKKQLRLHIAEMTSNVISSGMGLLGIRVPERM